ncbi:hypothetical protein EJA72_14595 [Pseudomonas sp. PB120]|nr:hypothetical protein [Pseudomonas sp. PB120]
MEVNDNACFLDARGALKSIASKLAPTGVTYFRPGWIARAPHPRPSTRNTAPSPATPGCP